MNSVYIFTFMYINQTYNYYLSIVYINTSQHVYPNVYPKYFSFIYHLQLISIKSLDMQK